MRHSAYLRAELSELAEILRNPEPMTTTEVARELGVSSPTTIKNWFEGGLFPGAYQTAGGHWRFSRDEVLRVRREMQQTRERNRTAKFELKNAGRYDPHSETA